MTKFSPENRIDISGPIFFVMLGLAAFSLSLGVPNLLHIYDVRAWTATPAEITTSALKEAGKSKSGGQFYLADLEYRYHFQGQTYLGRRYFPDQFLYGGKFLQLGGQEEAIVAKHPVGTQITVLVDPENPENSTVEAPIDFFTIFLLVFGIGFVTLSLVGMYLKKVLTRWARQRRQRVQQEPLQQYQQGGGAGGSEF
jgi:hypothetical protein